jgi:GT2 family glycosyltransferase
MTDRFGNVVNRGGGERDDGRYDVPLKVSLAMALFDKEVLKEAGWFDEAFFAFYEETDLCWRIRRMGHEIWYVPQAVIFHIGSATTSYQGKGKMKTMREEFVFHFHKNRLRMILKNQSGLDLVTALAVYSLDVAGLSVFWLAERNRNLPVLLRAIFWNFRNLRSTIQARKRVSATARSGPFIPYIGFWRNWMGQAAHEGGILLKWLRLTAGRGNETVRNPT